MSFVVLLILTPFYCMTIDTIRARQRKLKLHYVHSLSFSMISIVDLVRVSRF
uniref:Uncharacterized protein n=1 Tax=Amphimedon queenslandica TaxID=400682 RepID=A0A1X7V290_AMPQE